MRSETIPGGMGLAKPLALLVLMAGCTDTFDPDLRGGLGAFSTTPAVQGATADRPEPDARGVISYPTYQVAVARSGDTVATVAARVGLPAEEVARYNGIGVDVAMRGGEVLALPSRVPEAPGSVDIASLANDAIDAAPDTTPVATTALAPAQTRTEPARHRVTRGETAYTIARLYQVPVASLAEWNGLGPDFAVREGQYLLIPVADQTPPVVEVVAVTEPGAGTPTPTPPSASTPLPDETVIPAAETPEPAQSVAIAPPTQSPSSNAAMGFPVQGSIVRTYSKGRNDGIDIAAAPGAPVKAAQAGTVAAITADADGVPIVVVRHDSNLLTVYANVTGISVAKGDTVSRGQSIAELRDGDDAYVHFEVREGFESVDPIPYLE